MHIAKEDRPVVKLRCLSALQQLQISEKGKEHIADFVKIYLKLEPSEELVFEKLLERLQNKNEVIEMVSTWRGEGRLEGRKEGRLEGRKEGLLEGRNEGRLEEAVALVVRLLTKKFGSLPTSIPEQIRTMTVEQIEQLAEDLLDFSSLDDVANWMATTKKIYMGGGNLSDNSGNDFK
jgi:flagellar biosynthesis/type III secretory pathway protein FliH